MTVWPDKNSNSLPTRAYLRSVLDQTIPTRKAALADSVGHFREATTSDDRGWADMAFLGVIADAMQVLEDLAYVGESFTVGRFHGLPYYVGAITYNPRVPTNFYGRKRSDDDLRVLASYAVEQPSSGKIINVIDDVFGGSLSQEARAAFREAEDVTITVLRASLNELGDTWKRFSEYFHAFKHGGLVPHRADFQLVNHKGDLLEPAIAVWLRKRNEPHAHGNAEGQTDVARVVRELQLRTEIAFDIIDLAIASRLGLAEHASLNEPGPPDDLMRITFPVRFKLGQHAISNTAQQELQALGINFTERQQEVID